ncbi:unnamed protein product [Closterium sp. NIES-53]
MGCEVVGGGGMGGGVPTSLYFLCLTRACTRCTRPCTTQRLPLEQPPPLLHSVQPPLPHPAPALAATAFDLPAPTFCNRSAAFSPPTPSSFISLQPCRWGVGCEGVGELGEWHWGGGCETIQQPSLHLSSLPPSAAPAAVWGGGGGGGLAVRSHLPSSERAHFGQYKTATTLYDAVVARYSSPNTAALSRLMLPYLFLTLPPLSQSLTSLLTSTLVTPATALRFPLSSVLRTPPPMYITLYYLVTRLPDSLASVKDHFLSLCPTELTVDLLEERLTTAEKSIVANVAIFDLDFDAILAAMYAATNSAEGDCYLCVPPDPGIEAAALGASESAAPGTSESDAPGTSESAAPGAGESALSGTAPTDALHTFTLDSGASRSFFRDSTTLTPLSRPTKSLYDAVIVRYSSPATSALSRLMLPYLFPDLAAFATIADLITHLRTSDARYRAALPIDQRPLFLPLPHRAHCRPARGAPHCG